MSFIKALSLKTRFLITPILAVFLTVTLFIAGNYVFKENQSTFEELQQTDLPQIAKLNRISLLLTRNHTLLNNLLIEAIIKPDEEHVYLSGKKIINQLHSIEHEFDAIMKTRHELVLKHDMRTPFEDYRNRVVNIVEIATVDANLANLKLKEANMAIQLISERLLLISNESVQKLEDNVDLVEISLRSHQWLPYFTVLILVIMIIIGLKTANLLSKDLLAYTDVLRDLSRGKTDIDLPDIDDHYLEPLKNASEKFITTLQEGSERKAKMEKMIAELEDSQNRTETLLDVTPNAIIVIDKKLNIVVFNQSAETLFSYESEAVVGKQFEMLFSQQDRSYAVDKVIRLFGSPSHGRLEIRHTTLKAIDGNHAEFTGEIQLTKMELSQEELVVLVISDITERQQHEQNIWNQAHFDNLTGLPNRLYSIELLEQKIAEATQQKKQIAVLFIDLDNFKKINDSLGHDAGDELLKGAANLLKKNDHLPSFVGRLSGDEFVMVIEAKKVLALLPSIAKEIIEAFRRPISTKDHELITTISLGASIYPRDGHDADNLLQKADVAMYHAKDTGRNNYTIYTEEMNIQFMRRISIEQQLTNAINNKEFTLVYQPQFEASTTKLVGLEALLRWNSEKLGSISPVEFIPIAEQTGQILDIGEFVLNESLCQLKNWQASYDLEELKISVNLSPVQFRDKRLIDKIKNLLSNIDLKASSVNLEVTEGVLINENFELDLLQSLKQVGVSIALDDFGTGYSSLSYLQKYPFDYLKIDRAFINNCTDEGSSDQQLTSAIVAMAQAMDLKIIAEGVEHNEQLEFLRALGVDEIQGFLLGRPVNAEGFERQFLQK